MDAKEALVIMQGVEEIRGTFPEDGNLVEEALSVVVNALKKQIPETPVEGYVFSDAWREHLKKKAPGMAEKKGSCCPSCGEHIGESEAILKHKNYHAYCKWCGQALKQEEAQ